MKKLLAFLLVFSLLAGFSVSAAATEADDATEPTNTPREPGYCGESITWTLNDGVLHITGVGEMDDFPEGAPWAQHREDVTKVIISSGITYVGSCSFYDFDALETVEFGADVYEIGKQAFFSCGNLAEIHLPASFKVFGESSFMACSKLTEIHCEGKFPSFRQNCMWDTYATIYFPAERPWGVDYIQQLEEAFHGRIEFLASDGSDPYVPTEPSKETEPTQPETTEPPTEKPTELPTEAPEPITEPIAVTEATEATEHPTEAPTMPSETQMQPTEPEDDKDGGINWIPVTIFGAAAAFLILGTVIFRATNRRGRYSNRRRRR